MKRPSIASTFLALLLAAAASAAHGQARIVPDRQKPGDADATQAPPSGDVTSPVWSRLPTSAEFTAHLPARAKRMGRAGSAVMRCTVKSDGGLDHCVALSETPANLGFGAAAVDMAGYFQMAAKTTDGRPVGGLTITLTVEFAPPS